MALAREVKALTAILADEQNEDKTAEELAAELIDALDETRAKQPRMAVVVRHRWSGPDYSLAVLGPFGARAEAQMRRVGEEACASLAHPGDGRAVAVPVYASPRAAWEVLKPPTAADLLREQVARDVAAWTPGSIWTGDDSDLRRCSCGVGPLDRAQHCPRHPKAVQ